MLDRDGVVALAPDEQRGELAEQVEPVDRADMLAPDVDHRAERLQKRLARRGLLEGAHRARDRLEVDALATAPRAHAVAGALDAFAHPAVRHQPDPGGSAR